MVVFSEESVIEAVDVNGTREVEKLPDNFDGRFGYTCVLAQVVETFFVQTTCTGLLELDPQLV